MQSNNSNKSRPVSRGARRRNGARSQSQGVGNYSTDSPGKFKTLNLVFPPRMNMKLKFFAQPSFDLHAVVFANYRFRPSAAFDVDPALGGTAMAGFAEMAAQYSTYRVIASKIKVSISNPSATIPVTLVVLPMNADPTNAFSAANVIASTGNPYAKMKDIPLLGSGAAHVTNQMQTKVIYGDPAVLYDHNFSSLVTTTPTNNWFWNICVYSPAVIATLFYSTVEIEVDCEFFDRFFLPV